MFACHPMTEHSQSKFSKIDLHADAKKPGRTGKAAVEGDAHGQTTAFHK